MTRHEQLMPQKIGPSPEERLRRADAWYESQTEAIEKRVSAEDLLGKELEAEYGKDLLELGQAYNSRDESPAKGMILFKGYYLTVDVIRGKYADALTRALESQPVQKKSAWLDKFLEDLDKYPFFGTAPHP